MDKSLYYAESARRRARKAKALEEGEAEQQRHGPTQKIGPLWEHRPARPEPQASAGSPRAPARPTRPPQTRPPTKSVPGRPPVPTAKPIPPPPGKTGRPVSARPTQAGTVRRPPASRAGSRAGSKPKMDPSELLASEERKLLESQELDLFGTGKGATPHVCPQCQHELAKVVCMGVSVRVCVECMGTWMPYPVVQEFASKIEWFRELRPAVQRYRSNGGR